MSKKPPIWRDALSGNVGLLSKLLANEGLDKLLQKANAEYLHWEKFRYQPMPGNIDPALAWAMLKMTRVGNREVLPLVDEKKSPFSIFLTKEHLKGLSYIDSYASGAIASSEALPTGLQKENLVINGLMEEAISSSQIEGASTTRKVAKAMIEMNRAPKNRDERMILNNYLAMRAIEEWQSRPLDDTFLKELHEILTQGTLDEDSDVGRFREDADEIVVKDRLTGETVHTPPKMSDARLQLEQLYKFANSDNEDAYLHPFVKACILHFQLAYIHPFVDGNGRSARALFYWYLLKKNYWGFKFLPISLQIKKKEWRPGYDKAFQLVETDEGDITYFLSYKIKLAKNAIGDFIKYIEKKKKDTNRLREKLTRKGEINSRQIDLIDLLKGNPSAEIDFQFYMNRNGVVYQTARTDILGLVEKKILKQDQIGKKYIFSRGENFPM